METMTTDRILFRIAGVAAMAGALLRLVTAIPSILAGRQGREGLYLTVDLLLLFGLFGLFAHQARLRRGIGPLGFAIAVLGFVLIRTGPRIGAFATYEFAASVLAIGLAVMAASVIRVHGWMRATGAAWIASLVVGLVGAALRAPFGFLAASLLFCLGFAFAGMLLLASPEARQEPRA
jgi:hypothetical protein